MHNYKICVFTLSKHTDMHQSSQVQFQRKAVSLSLGSHAQKTWLTFLLFTNSFLFDNNKIFYSVISTNKESRWFCARDTSFLLLLHKLLYHFQTLSPMIWCALSKPWILNSTQAMNNYFVLSLKIQQLSLWYIFQTYYPAL